jgi:trimeric autotransporter adhesin
MPVIAKLFSLFRPSRFSIAKVFSMLSLLMGLLASLAIPQLAFAQTQITNTASITAPASVTNTNTATACVAGTCSAVDSDTITASAPTVTKTFTPTTISAGGTSLLVITFTNTHKLVSATFSTAFVDLYPAGLTNAAAPLAATTCTGGAVTATAGAGQLSLPVGTLIAPNASCSVSAVVTSATSPLAANTIPAGSLTTSVGANPSAAIATLTVNPSADLAIIKTTSNATPNAGSTFTYTIVIVNNGPSAVTNATWTDTLPTGLGTITNIVPSAGITATTLGGTISGTSTLANGQRATVTFQVSVAPGATGTLTNTASVTAPVGTTDPTPGNNSSSVPVTVGLVADLAIIKTTSNATPNAGNTFTYTIVIVNNGPSAVTNATWTDTLPVGLGTITNVVPSAGITAGAAGNTISGTSTLLNGQSATVTFQVSVAPGATGTLTNTASVTAPVGTTDPTPGNNSSSVPVTVGLVADLAITKTPSTGNPSAGGTFTYTVVIVNNGPSAVTNATWTDTLPVGLGTITNIVPSAGITAGAAGNTISGTSTLLNGQSATVTFQVSVAPGATGTLTNTASVTAPVGTTDPTPGNNASSTPVTIGQLANLSVAKTNGTTSVTAGGTTAYTITYSNGGPSAANGALVKDVASAGLQCTSVTCTATTGGASCPSSMPLGTAVLIGATNFFAAGETIGTFPANSNVTLVVNCNVTATGQ